MAQILSIALSGIALACSFVSPLGAWLPLILAAAFFFMVYISLKRRRWRIVEELSLEANEMLQKFGHYYAMPFAGRDFSSAVSTLMFAGVGVGIIGALKGFWWGLLVAVAFWLALGPVAMAYNPTNLLRDEQAQKAHREIIQWLRSRWQAS